VPEGFAYIAGGTFQMGRNSDDPFESPAHEATVKPFLVEKYEVTNRRYADFVQASGYTPPPQWVDGKYSSGQADLPVTGVSWNDAVKYCEWRSRQTGATYRLPTEAEWEFAVRRSEDKFYPWGADWKNDAANIKEARRNGPADVGSFRLGETTEGISDLIGNVAEWTSDDLKLYPNSRGKLPEGSFKVIRGGHFNSAREKASATYREWLRPTGDDYATVGFRCVREIN
jgi:formylglycine-generating enzyme required for sulfatase activity